MLWVNIWNEVVRDNYISVSLLKEEQSKERLGGIIVDVLCHRSYKETTISLWDALKLMMKKGSRILARIGNVVLWFTKQKNMDDSIWNNLLGTCAWKTSIELYKASRKFAKLTSLHFICARFFRMQRKTEKHKSYMKTRRKGRSKTRKQKQISSNPSLFIMKIFKKINFFLSLRQILFLLYMEGWHSTWPE